MAFITRMSTTQTSRISIDVTVEQHKRLKAIAALSGQSLKNYLLQRTLPQNDENAAIAEPEALLAPRVESARAGRLVDESVQSIFDGVARERVA